MTVSLLYSKKWKDEKMSERNGKLAAMLKDIAGDAANFSGECLKFSEEYEELSDDEILRRTAHLLNGSEWTFLKSKYLAYFVSVKNETEGEVKEIELNGSLDIYDIDYLVFNLSPMVNLRKKHERTGLGRVTFHEVLSLISEYRREYPGFTFNHPVVKFIHHVTEDDYQNGWIPDADNLDTAKAVDALVTGILIADDSCLAMDIVHEGVISDRAFTEMQVYEKGKKRPKKVQKSITSFAPDGTRLNEYSFSPV